MKTEEPKNIIQEIVHELKIVLPITAVICLVSVVVFFLYHAIPLVVSSASAFFQDASKDGLLSFLGGLSGGLLTMLGVLITIKFESSKARKERLQQSQPIILLQHWDGENTADTKKNITEKLILSEDTLRKCEGTRKAEKVYEKVPMPNIVLRNIGFNIALNIHYHLKFDAQYTSVDGMVDYMPENESAVIKMTAEVQWAALRKANDKGVFIGRGQDSWLASALKSIHDEELLKAAISYVSMKGKLEINYLDVLGNAYYQGYDVTLWLTTLSGSQNRAFLTFPSYTRKTYFKKKEKYDRDNDVMKKLVGRYWWTKY